MSVTRHHLASVIGERTLKTHNSKLLAREIAAYLLEERNTASLESLIRDIMQYRADKGVVEIMAVSSHDLNTEVISDIKKMLQSEYQSAKHITINPVHDESVIGGVRIDQANEQLDLTTRAKLNKFKRLTGAQKGMM